MPNMPLLAPQLAQPAAATAKKSADARQENSGFSDVYDDMDGANERPSDDLPQAKEAQADHRDDAVDDSDSHTKSQKSAPEKEAPEEADFAAIEADTPSEAEPEVATRSSETRAPAPASENAAMLRMAQGAQGAQEQANAALAKSAAATTETLASVAAQPAAASMQPSAKGEKMPMADAQSAKIAAETAEGLDPMQVQVRNKGAQPAHAQPPNAAVLAAQQAQTKASTQEAALQKAAAAEAEASEEMSTAKQETPSAPTPSATQQMQARAIVEQVQSGSQTVLAKAAETAAGQISDGAVPAAMEDHGTNHRGIMSAQEAASQARLANSAPNPAYVVRQMADAVKMGDKNLIELTLDPPELGKVRMSLAETGGVMAVTISADSQATTELMRRHMDLLRKDFMEMGYEDVSFSFEQGSSDGSEQQAQMNNGFGQGGGSQGESARADETQTDASPALAAQQLSQISAASSGVDIRL